MLEDRLPQRRGFLLPAKSLASWIDDNLYLNLGEAPFPLEDATLVPEEGACPDCPRRTGYNNQLFGDVQGDQCLDPKCYHTKVAVFIERIKAAEPELVQISTTWRSKEERRETLIQDTPAFARRRSACRYMPRMA